MSQITNVTIHVVFAWNPGDWTFIEAEAVLEIEGDQGRVFIQLPQEQVPNAGIFARDAYARWADVKAIREQQ